MRTLFISCMLFSFSPVHFFFKPLFLHLVFFVSGSVLSLADAATC
jgi:hypothetical protein